jgi:hypothetical protein
MRIDADVLEAFKVTGQGWQSRINAALREAVANGLTKAKALCSPQGEHLELFSSRTPHQLNEAAAES